MFPPLRAPGVRAGTAARSATNEKPRRHCCQKRDPSSPEHSYPDKVFNRKCYGFEVSFDPDQTHALHVNVHPAANPGEHCLGRAEASRLQGS